MSNYVTVAQAANSSGFSVEHLRLLCRTSRIDATQFGQTWAIDPGTLAAYLATDRRRGRKPRTVLEAKANES